MQFKSLAILLCYGFCYSESFDQRAPKRKQVVKMKKSLPILPCKTISDRPPAALPEDEEISFENHPEYVPIGVYTHTMPALGSRQNSVEYECVKPRSNTIPKLRDANTVLTQGKNVTCSYNSIISDHDHVYSCGISR